MYGGRHRRRRLRHEAPSADENRLLEVFRRWDQDNSGGIDQGELHNVLVEIGFPTEAIEDLFISADANTDGQIDYAEFVRWVAAPGMFTVSVSIIRLSGEVIVSDVKVKPTDGVSALIAEMGGSFRNQPFKLLCEDRELQHDASIALSGIKSGSTVTAIAMALPAIVPDVQYSYCGTIELTQEGKVDARTKEGYPMDIPTSDQLKDGVQEIFSTSGAFAALKVDGSVVAWGSAKSGGNASDVADKLEEGVQTVCSTQRSFAALKSCGSVVVWGDVLGMPASDVAEQLTDGVQAIFSNDDAFAALKVCGSVIAWGERSDAPLSGGDASSVAGQLKDGVQSIVSTRCAFAALKADGSVVAWGDNEYGGDASNVAEQLKGEVRVITSNNAAFAALKVGGSVVAWGSNVAGGVAVGGGGAGEDDDEGSMDGLGMDGDWRSQLLESRGGRPCSSVADQLQDGVQEIISTYDAFAARKVNGSVVAWGSASDGGSTGRVASQLESGVQTVCSTECGAFAALKSDGSVVRWGSMKKPMCMGHPVYDVVDELDGGVQAICGGSRAFAALKVNGSVITWIPPAQAVRCGGVQFCVEGDLDDGVLSISSKKGMLIAVKSDGSVVVWH